MSTPAHETEVVEFALDHWRAQCSCGWTSAAYGLRRTAQAAANAHERKPR